MLWVLDEGYEPSTQEGFLFDKAGIIFHPVLFGPIWPNHAC